MKTKLFILILSLSSALFLLISINFVINMINFGTQQHSSLENNIIDLSKEGLANNENVYLVLDDNIASYFIYIESGKSLTLNSNVKEKFTSNEIIENNNCDLVVNAGFITKDYSHIGLFKNHVGLISKYLANDTFNGILISDENGSFSISDIPVANSSFSLQAGPLIRINYIDKVLKLKNDENARRVVAAIDDKNNLMFILFFNKENLLLGPKLSDLPYLLNIFDDKTDIDISDAINLDGGSHSVFITDDVKILESSFIGGYFCIKN